MCLFFLPKMHVTNTWCGFFSEMCCLFSCPKQTQTQPMRRVSISYKPHDGVQVWENKMAHGSSLSLWRIFQCGSTYEFVRWAIWDVLKLGKHHWRSTPYGHMGSWRPKSSAVCGPSSCCKWCHKARAMGIGDIMAHSWTRHGDSTSCGKCHNVSTSFFVFFFQRWYALEMYQNLNRNKWKRDIHPKQKTIMNQTSCRNMNHKHVCGSTPKIGQNALRKNKPDMVALWTGKLIEDFRDPGLKVSGKFVDILFQYWWRMDSSLEKTNKAIGKVSNDLQNLL